MRPIANRPQVLNLPHSLSQRGGVLTEFALCAAFLVPILLGTFVFGMNLTRSIQVTQLSRDAGHMYVRSLDFSQPGNQKLLLRLARGLNMDPNDDGNPVEGNGVIVLSRITFLGDQQCIDAGVTIAQCANHQQAVMTQRIVIGNPSVKASSFGTPSPSIVQANGDILPADYVRDVSARATGFSNLLALQPGDFAYVSEAYFRSPDYDIPGFRTGSGIYARTIF